MGCGKTFLLVTGGGGSCQCAHCQTRLLCCLAGQYALPRSGGEQYSAVAHTEPLCSSACCSRWHLWLYSTLFIAMTSPSAEYGLSGICCHHHIHDHTMWRVLSGTLCSRLALTLLPRPPALLFALFPCSCPAAAFENVVQALYKYVPVSLPFRAMPKFFSAAAPVLPFRRLHAAAFDSTVH